MSDEAIVANDAPGEQDTSREQRRPTLRLALAMRGGVSLAVWTGGAVAELDVLRRATETSPGKLSAPVPLPPPPKGSTNREIKEKEQRERLREMRRRIYRDLLDLADIDHVEIDVLAGASAGGLNAVLYGTALANGKRIDDMREVWAGLADLPVLLRPTAKWWWRLVPSPLRGDEYFYLQLQQRLTELAKVDGQRPEVRDTAADPDEPQPAARYLTVALSATVLPKIDRHGVREQRERGVDSGRASFSFDLRPTGGKASVLSDLPAGNTCDPKWRAFMVDRLALAGRSTASFPGGFEPARVYAYQDNHEKIRYHQRPRRRPWKKTKIVLEDSMSRYRRRPLIAMPDMIDVFSATRPNTPEEPKEPFGVVDGGVFDNIAIGRALTAIAHAAAVVHTRRWLIYLDPDPVKAPVPRFGSLRPPAFTVPRLLLSLAGMRAASRTVRDDLEGLQQHNERAQARRAETEAFSRQLTDRVRGVAAEHPTDDLARARALWKLGQQLAYPGGARTPNAYARYRAATDLPRLTRLLVRPQLTISGQAVRTQGFSPWSEDSIGEVMLQLREPLQDWYAEPGNGVVMHLDLTAVIDTADFLITWTRVLELWHYKNNFTTAGPQWTVSTGDRKRLKRVLYRVLFLATALRDLADQEMLDKPGSAEESPTSDPPGKRVRAALKRVHDRQGKLQISSRLHEFFNITRDLKDRRTPADSDATFYDAVDAYFSGDPTDPDRGVPPGERLDQVQKPANLYFWTRLTELFHAVRSHSTGQLAPDPALDAGDDRGRPWVDSPFDMLTAYPELVLPDPVAPHKPELALATLGPIFAGAGGLPDSTQMVNFDTFTADQFSPLYPHMDGLRGAVKADWARSMLQGRMPVVHRPWLDSRTKLAGNQLANFAGFLDRRWRNNDWLWGRADSAANAVSLIFRQVNPRHLEAGPDTGRKDDVIRAANRLAVRVGKSERGSWGQAELRDLEDAVTEALQLNIVEELLPVALDDEKPRRRRSGEPTTPERADLAHFTTGQETPAVLSPRLRSGLIMHAGLLFFRATMPSSNDLRTFFMWVAAQVARPVYVLALLLATPARAGLLLGLVLAGAAVSDVGGEGHAEIRAGVLWAVAVIGCLLLVLRADATGRRVGEARDAVASSQADKRERRLITSDHPDARADAVKLANEAIDLIRRIYRRRLTAASITVVVATGLASGVWLSWNRFSPWLGQGNWAAFAGLVTGELGAFGLIWRVSEWPLRARTGRRRPTQPWLIWTLAAGAVGTAAIVGHFDSLIRAINPSGSESIADGDARLAITVGAVLLCAMVTVSTYDWMHPGWLVPAYVASLAIYGGLLFGLDGLGLPNTVFGDVLLAAVAYGLSFTYLITMFASSRYPGRAGRLKEPPKLR